MRTAGVCLLICATVGSVAAQSGDKAAAQAAFDKGRELMKSGQLVEACKQFATSQRLDPQLGTLFNLGLCHEKIGKLASAWAELDEVSAKDAVGKRKDTAAQHVAALAPRLSRLLVKVEQVSDGFVLTRDDLDITALIGVATPVDPGTYALSARATGRWGWDTKVEVRNEGETVVIEVPVLIDEHPGHLGSKDRGAKPVEPSASHRHVGRGRRIIGGAVTGGGLASIGVGLYFGVQARSLADDARELCGGELDPCMHDIDLASDTIGRARDQANLANIFVGAGAAAVIGGVILWVTAPHERAAIVPVVAGDQVGLAIGGVY